MSAFGVDFNKILTYEDNIVINGVKFPDPSEPVALTFNNISDGGRLADSVDYEGNLNGTKVNISLKYAALDKEHYDKMFNATQGAYLNKEGFFMSITVPTYTPLGPQTYRGYFMSEHSPNCTQTTDRQGIHYGSTGYDELHEDVEFSFVQK
jgi:hypothetical protein